MGNDAVRMVRRIGVPGEGIWLGGDGVWRLEDENSYEFIPGLGLILVGSEKRNPLERGKLFGRWWGISFLCRVAAALKYRFLPIQSSGLLAGDDAHTPDNGKHKQP
jgi:hypothetical protein